MEESAKIYVLDDDDLMRSSLKFQLESKGYPVRGFSKSDEFLREARWLAPGVLILDLRMPHLDGLAVQQRLFENRLSFPIIMITGHGDVELAVRAMRAGAVDFVEKPFSRDRILDSVELAKTFLRPEPAEERTDEIAAVRMTLLTPREREVLEGLVSGLTNKGIARVLAVSPRTVENHRARVMEKMQARTLPELVRFALVAGIQPKM